MRPDKFSSFTHTDSTIWAANWSLLMVMASKPIQVMPLESGGWSLKARLADHHLAHKLWKEVQA